MLMLGRFRLDTKESWGGCVQWSGSVSGQEIPHEQKWETLKHASALGAEIPKNIKREPGMVAGSLCLDS